MLDELAKYSFPFDEDRSSQRLVMVPSQTSVSALWMSTPFKTGLRPLVEHRLVAGARFPHSCRGRSSQLQSHVMTHVDDKLYPEVTRACNVHKGGPVTCHPARRQAAC